MPKPTVENFLAIVGRSGLVEQEPLEAALADLRRDHAGALPDDSQAVADFLIARQLITPWQAERLLEGRFKGFLLGNYKLLSLLGAGGMSAVYLAEHKLMRTRRAIKILPSARVEDSSYLARFYREAQAAGALEHPNIVRAYDVAQDGKTHYLVMEYVAGRDLQDIVDQDGPLDYQVAADFVRQAAEGLAYAHEKGMVHRDVKPANLLLDKSGTVKVLDMGLALVERDEQVSLTIQHDENVLGTADYLPPEQAINSHTVDHRADIYSLGGTLYFLLTGHPPFPEGTLAQRLHMHQTQEPASILNDRPDAPAGLIEICQKMMAKKPDDRFASARDVVDALTGWMADPQSRMITGRFAQILGGRTAILPTRSSQPGEKTSGEPGRGAGRPGDTVSGSTHSTVKGPSGRAAAAPGGVSPERDEDTIELADIPDVDERKRPGSKPSAASPKPPSGTKPPSGIKSPSGVKPPSGTRWTAPAKPDSAVKKPDSGKGKSASPPVEVFLPSAKAVQPEKMLNELEQLSKTVERPQGTGPTPIVRRPAAPVKRDWTIPVVLGALGLVLLGVAGFVIKLIVDNWQYIGKTTGDL